MTRFIVRCLWLLLAIHFTPLATAAETLSGIGISAGNNWWRSWVDLNGDGRADYCYRYDPDGERIRCFFSKDGQYTNTPDIDVGIGRNHQPYQWWHDVDGDGLADLCRGYDYKTPNFRIECRFAKDKFQKFAEVALPFAGYCSDSDCLNMSKEGIVRSGDVFFSDVNGDQRTDLCFVYSTNAANAPFDLRCRLSSGSSFGPMTSPWTSVPINPGSIEFPRSFVDVNGDGFPDFCRTLLNSTLSCLLGAENGFTATDLVSPVVDLGYKEGASFIDSNADGKTDYCRITGTAGKYQLRCTPSTGVGWDTANERISPVIPDVTVGHARSRWWIDINADGLPDFCRSVGADPDPSGGAYAEIADISGTLSCRLNKGDGASTDPTGAFYYSDIEVPTNFGRGDGGRQWCDATGSGFPTLCRNSFSRTYSTTQECVDDGSNGEGGSINLVCHYPVLSETHALITGLGTSEAPQASHPLLTAYTDGLGAETRIGYLPLTSPEVYTRSGITNTDRRFVGPPPTSPVVYETRAWMVGSSGAGGDLTGNARYFYRDLTNDPWAGTSRGFSERWMFNEGSNTIDHTQFFQGLGDGNGSVANDLREVGMVRRQMRYVINSGVVPTPADNGSGSGSGSGSPRPPRKKNEQAILAKVVDVLGGTGGTASKQTIASKTSTGSSPFILLQSTGNTLRDTEPANPRYRYVGESNVQGYDYNGSSPVDLPTARTVTTQDNHGNVTRIEQTKSQYAAGHTLTWTTTTENTYDSDPKWLRLGRLKASTVTSSAPSLEAQIAANARSAGTSANASAVSSSLAAVSQDKPKPLPLPPQLLMPILQLLLED